MTMPSTRSCIFYGLNATRFLSVIVMLLVFASGIFVLVNDVRAVNHFMAAKQSGNATADAFAHCDYIENSTVPNQPAGVFWAIVNRLLIIFEIVVLILSELPPSFMTTFFELYFPVLGPDFGVGALGIFQCLIGATILSHHVDDFTLVAAFFLFAVGCLNMLLGLIFREGGKQKRSIRRWKEEGKGVLPTTIDRRPTVLSAHSGFSEKTGPVDEFTRNALGFGRQGTKHSGLKEFHISKPMEAVVPYAPPPRPASVSSEPQDNDDESLYVPHHKPTHSRQHSEYSQSSGGSSRSHSPSPSYRSHSPAPSSRRGEMPMPTFLSSETAV